MTVKSKSDSSFHVGDQVWLPLGVRKVPGVIVEDRGPIGVGGRRLFVISVPDDPFEPTSHTRGEDEIELVDPKELEQSVDKHAAIEYLKNGGLISILRSNLSGGTNQPHVWLCRDSFGNITHTFVEERGVVGGLRVPFAAVYDNKVFTPMKEQVVAFLKSFTLDENNAREVIRAVGTAP
jgi:hypothetical protein